MRPGRSASSRVRVSKVSLFSTTSIAGPVPRRRAGNGGRVRRAESRSRLSRPGSNRLVLRIRSSCFSSPKISRERSRSGTKAVGRASRSHTLTLRSASTCPGVSRTDAAQASLGRQATDRAPPPGALSPSRAESLMRRGSDGACERSIERGEGRASRLWASSSASRAASSARRVGLVADTGSTRSNSRHSSVRGTLRRRKAASSATSRAARGVSGCPRPGPRGHSWRTPVEADGAHRAYPSSPSAYGSGSARRTCWSTAM
jgi:hypothetical protein